MKKIVMMSILILSLTGRAPLFAASAKSVSASSGVSVTQAPKDTIFNRLSDFFSEFDKTYTRRGNKQGFWNATADWMRNINKQ